MQRTDNYDTRIDHDRHRGYLHANKNKFPENLLRVREYSTSRTIVRGGALKRAVGEVENVSRLLLTRVDTCNNTTFSFHVSSLEGISGECELILRL